MRALTKITSNYFKYGGLKYFRHGSPFITLGSYGIMKGGSVFGKAYLEVEGDVKPQKLVGKIKLIPPKEISWNTTTRTSFEAEGKPYVFSRNNSAGAEMSFESAQAGDVHLVGFSINRANMKEILNNGAGRERKYLADEGKDGRIVGVIWIALTGFLAEFYQNSADLRTTVGTTAGTIEANATKENDRSVTIILGSGSIFAYSLYKVKKWDKETGEIIDLEDEHYGMG